MTIGDEVDTTTPAVTAETSDGGLRRVLDTLPRAIAIGDPDGRVRLWNRAAERVLGRCEHEMLGRSLTDALLLPDYREEGRTVIAMALAGGKWEGDLRVRRADGRLIRLHGYVLPLLDGNGTVIGVVAAADDVTEQRRLEREVAELAEHLQLALGAGDLGTWQWDLSSGRVHWDTALEDLFGLAPGGFQGTFDHWVGLLHPDDVDHVLQVLDRALEHRSHYQVDHRILRPDGTVRWLHGRGAITVDDSGRVNGAVGCTADITSRKEAELRAESRARRARADADRARLERDRLEFLVQLSDAALNAEDHGSFMDLATALAVPRLGDWCALYFVPDAMQAAELSYAHNDPDRVRWLGEVLQRFPISRDDERGIAAVARTGIAEVHFDITPQLLDERLADDPEHAEELRAVVAELGLTSVITVPLRTKQGVLGAVQFASAESGRRYAEEDVALARAAAGRIAAALDTLWFADQQRHIAATLQEALLPSTLPVVPGVEIATRYWPAGMGDVGGDFYDVFPNGDAAWAVVIGDVCGKGPEAAAVTGMMRHTARVAARHGGGPAEVLSWMNEALLHSDEEPFCTVTHAVLARSDDGWNLTVACGGHPPAIVVRTDGRTEVVGRPGTLLGVMDHLEIHPRSVTLQPGDTVVFHTDGITDVRPPHGLTPEQLSEVVRGAAAAGTAEEVAEGIRHQVADALPMVQRQDDIALVVLRITDS